MAELVWGAAPSSSTTKAVTVDGTIYGSNTTLAFVGFNTNSSASNVAVSHSTQGSLTRVGTFQTGNGSLDVFTLQNMVAGDVTASWSGGGITNQLMIVAVENGTGVAADTQDIGNAATISLAAAGTTGDRVIGYACARFPDYAAIVTEGTQLTGAQQFASSFTVNATGDDYTGTLDHGFDFGAAGKSYCARSIAVSVPASTSITQTDDTPEDGVEQTVTCTGMTGPITSVTLGGVAVTPSSTDPSSPFTYTHDISAQTIETNQAQPRIGIPVDLVATTATDGAVSTRVTIGPKTGWALTELEDVLNKDAQGLLETLEDSEGITVTNTDAVYYDTSDNANVTVNGVRTSDLTLPGQFSKTILQVGATSPALTYSDNYYPYGESGGGTERKLTYSKLTGVKLTSTKLEASKL